jgi:hypothetical protein
MKDSCLFLKESWAVVVIIEVWLSSLNREDINLSSYVTFDVVNARKKRNTSRILAYFGKPNIRFWIDFFVSRNKSQQTIVKLSVFLKQDRLIWQLNLLHHWWFSNAFEKETLSIDCFKYRVSQKSLYKKKVEYLYRAFIKRANFFLVVEDSFKFLFINQSKLQVKLMK